MRQPPTEIKLKPIGLVRSAVTGEDYKSGRYQEMRAEVEIYPEFADGLDGIEGAEELWILYWMSELSPGDREILKVHPRGDPANPMRGVFSTRSPMRPNPIGLTRVRQIERRGNTLVVEGLDALDGTPVLDIKIEGDYKDRFCP
ncbi:MAG: tRNA (N6-threonylcarbamoyladenosine(37)-N6)-methyltransferase TrmO [bacterium]